VFDGSHTRHGKKLAYNPMHDTIIVMAWHAILDSAANLVLCSAAALQATLA
jgi:hypothetical protein